MKFREYQIVDLWLSAIMEVWEFSLPRRPLLVGAAVNDYQEYDDPDEEDIAIELWMNTFGCDLQISAIEVLIICGMRLPPANEGMKAGSRHTAESSVLEYNERL